MGGAPRSRKKGYTSKKKAFRKYTLGTKHRGRDLDQIELDLRKAGRAPGEEAMQLAEPDVAKYDEELPGGGLFYCVETARHFASADALAKHKLSKQFKNRVKQLKSGAFTQDDADAGAGMTKERLPPVSRT